MPTYWMADGHVYIQPDGGPRLKFTYDEWNALIGIPWEQWFFLVERIGRRHAEADRSNPP